MVHQSPYDFSVDTVKRLLEVDEDFVQGGLPLQGLYNDDPHVLSWRKPVRPERALPRAVFNLPGMESSMIPSSCCRIAGSLPLAALQGVFSSSLLALSPIPRACVGVGKESQFKFGCLPLVLQVVYRRHLLPCLT